MFYGFTRLSLPQTRATSCEITLDTYLMMTLQYRLAHGDGATTEHLRKCEMYSKQCLLVSTQSRQVDLIGW